MKIGELQQLFGISDTTIRTYIKNYETFFSSRHGKQRVYTEKDIKVLATILDAERDGFDKDAIIKRLKNEDFVEGPSMGEAMDTRLVPFSTVEQFAKTADIRVELGRIKSERDDLERRLEEEKDKVKSGLESIIQLQKELKENSEKITDLKVALKEAETRAEIKEDLVQQLKDAELLIRDLQYRLGQAEKSKKGWLSR